MFLVLYAWILVYNVLKEYHFFNIYVAGVWYHTVDPARYGRLRPIRSTPPGILLGISNMGVRG